jgi:tRNA threonylcarbamoyladenosine biosynthesis protein TsaE
MIFESHSIEETIALGKKIGEILPPNSVLCFFGDLGAGKTTFIKGLVEGGAEIPKAQVNSPTFVYLNIYEGKKIIYHFDLYRLKDSEEFLSMGFDEMLFAGGICCIEWAEKITSFLPANCITIEMSHIGPQHRQISINPWETLVGII